VAAIYRFIYAKVGNREEAEDLTSQVFVKALHRIDSSRDPQSVQGWLFQVARTTVADHWREFYRLRTDSLDGLLSDGWEAAADEATLPATQVDERVEQILSRLPNRYREVLTYRFLRNYSIKETAEKMRISEANVKVLQFRALRRAAREDPGVL
jgi:RNA polymerase sigma-70 factor (ECF subfamily)